jgi:hypothetical protein
VELKTRVVVRSMGEATNGAPMTTKALVLTTAVVALVFGLSPPDPDLAGGPSPAPPDPTVLAADPSPPNEQSEQVDQPASVMALAR